MTVNLVRIKSKNCKPFSVEVNRLSATFLIQDKTTGADLFFSPKHPERQKFKDVFEILKGDNFYS